MIDQPLHKPWPLARRIWIALWGAGLVCFIAALLLDGSSLHTAALGRGLKIAALVFWVGGFYFLIRWRMNE